MHKLYLPSGRLVLRLAALLATTGAVQAQTTTTFTFTEPGGPQTYTVPRGITQLRVVATGASGGAAAEFNRSPFSNGGRVAATVTVAPGEVLTVRVGGQGFPRNNSTYAYSGGYNGGGAGSNDNGSGGGGGGGATDLRRTGASTGDYLASRNALVVAGGGGGSTSTIAGARGGDGGDPNGGNGGGSNDSNPSIGGSPGQGATQTAPGAGTNGATSGSNGTGGSAGPYDYEGGGGGGGYYGGGGGSSYNNINGFYDAPGGGGSSWAMPGSAPTYSVADDPGNGELIITTVGIPLPPLPVELTAFTAEAAGPAAVRLAWATASEKNSARFEVERSLDGAAFAKIGEEAAAGNSSTAHAYAYHDAAAPAGQLYYRLRQVDADGTAAYSPVQAVALAATGALTLAPNPTRTHTLAGSLPAGAAVEVFDVLGRPVLRTRADAAGQAALALPAGLAPGLYLVRSGARTARLVLE